MKAFLLKGKLVPIEALNSLILLFSPNHNFTPKYTKVSNLYKICRHRYDVTLDLGGYHSGSFDKNKKLSPVYSR